MNGCMCAIAFIRTRDPDLLTFECSANERLILQLTRGPIIIVGSFSHYDIIVLSQYTCFRKYVPSPLMCTCLWIWDH